MSRKKRVQNIQELKKQINKILLDALNSKNSHTADEIKVVESMMVEKIVYKAYEPEVYRRRGESGGLADTRNMKHSASIGAGKVGLNIVNVTPQNTENVNMQTNDVFQASNKTLRDKTSLASLVEGGDGTGGLRYTYQNGGEYLASRPIQAETVRELKSSKKHLDALVSDLRSKG